MQAIINELNNRFNGLEAAEILSLASVEYGSALAFATSFGLEDQIILQMIAAKGLPIRIFTLDTGRLFPETYELIDRSVARFSLPIEIFFPDFRQVEKMVTEKGINLFYESIENRKQCCNVRKSEPLARALQGCKAWITGLRRQQSVTRHNMQVAEWDELHGLVKINPLIDWTEQQVKEYIAANKIPYNTLHDKGFPSIGCQPCTRAIAPGEDIRAGRWWWEQPEQKECGLHKAR
ncbi:MAG TPA: phosphoadenylyl-sulfate reductase [Bacteroidales bacterium]|nr:phosphoadenylyl-sulfate reductase [Bacteroidales bacterium]